MKIAVVALWLLMAVALYVGLRARLMPHQPRWQAGAIVFAVSAFFAVGVAMAGYFTSLPVHGEEDGATWGQD